MAKEPHQRKIEFPPVLTSYKVDRGETTETD